jgi:biopolymer transport protein ExbD
MPVTKARLQINEYNKKRKVELAGRERQIRIVSLSLTSMVDMFAILVIFLLTCTTSVSKWIETGHGIQLPVTKFSETPPKAASLQIARDAVYGEDKLLITVSQLLKGPISVEPIRNWLRALPQKDGKDGSSGFVNILGDETISFGAIKRVIASCQDAGYSNINLAVHPK